MLWSTGRGIAGARGASRRSPSPSGPQPSVPSRLRASAGDLPVSLPERITCQMSLAQNQKVVKYQNADDGRVLVLGSITLGVLPTRPARPLASCRKPTAPARCSILSGSCRGLKLWRSNPQQRNVPMHANPHRQIHWEFPCTLGIRPKTR